MAQMADWACRPADAELMAAQGIRWPGLSGKLATDGGEMPGQGNGRNQQMQKNLGKFEI
jgi:hypothetical protein